MINEIAMNIVEVFEFEDGRTILVGDVLEGPAFIKTTDCLIDFGDGRKIDISIEGEMISKPHKSNGVRSLSTRDVISVQADELRGATLRSR